MISKKGHTSWCTALLIALLTLATEVAAVGGEPLCTIKDVPRVTIQLADTADDSVIKPVGGGKVDWWKENQTYETQFRPQQIVVPAVLITIGALGVGENAPLRQLNVAVRSGMQELSDRVELRFDDYLQYAPVAFYLVLDYMGLKAKHSLGERVAVAATTYIAGTALTQGVKYTVCEKRPNSNRRNSFPSGHTMTAFAGAELIRTEYGWGAGACAYAVAATVGFMRMYNDRHWLNDVVAGAGFGILAARIGYWLLPLNRHIFKIPRKGQAIVATPTYNAACNALGISCAIQF